MFELTHRELRGLRAHMQMIFQDPYGPLDPRQRVEGSWPSRSRRLGGASRSERRERLGHNPFDPLPGVERGILETVHVGAQTAQPDA